MGLKVEMGRTHEATPFTDLVGDLLRRTDGDEK
jgi:hypothetical protein